MIERFNFYDVYGLLIPGASLLLLLFLPLGIVTGHWPSPSLASVSATLVAAYLLGHLIQSVALATEWLSSKIARDKNGVAGHPSVLMLNPSNLTLGDSLKDRIQKLVEQRFSIRLHVEQEIFLPRKEDEDKEKTDEQKLHAKIAKDRDNAFFLCRPIANKSISYAEQFQGLYSLMRGLCVVFTIGVFYDAAWFLSWQNMNVVVSLLVVSMVFLIAIGCRKAKHISARGGETSKNWEKYTIYAYCLMIFAVGHAWAMSMHVSARDVLILLAVAGFSCVAALHSFVLYCYYADQFAKAVWTYFAVLDRDGAL